jgi:ribosomal protein L1
MKQEIMEAVKKAKEQTKPRNFTQSIDVVMDAEKRLKSLLSQMVNWLFKLKRPVQI